MCSGSLTTFSFPPPPSLVPALTNNNVPSEPAPHIGCHYLQHKHQHEYVVSTIIYTISTYHLELISFHHVSTSLIQWFGSLQFRVLAPLLLVSCCCFSLPSSISLFTARKCFFHAGIRRRYRPSRAPSCRPSRGLWSQWRAVTSVTVITTTTPVWSEMK